MKLLNNMNERIKFTPEDIQRKAERSQNKNFLRKLSTLIGFDARETLDKIAKERKRKNKSDFIETAEFHWEQDRDD